MQDTSIMEKSHCENLLIRMYAGETKNQENYLKGLFAFY